MNQEEYLRTLRRRLRGFEDADEIVDEIRTHIVEKIEGGASADDVLARLGTADELATRYIAAAALARAEMSRTPIGVLDGLFRWATLSAAGIFVLSATIIGYFIGASLLLAAILKPFHPHTAGLWRVPDGFSLRLGFGTPPPGATDIAGWWIVPAGIIAGTIVVALTTRYALWCVRRARVVPR
jgi:hypothetical protein